MMLKSDKFLVEWIEHWDHETFDVDVSDDDDFGEQIFPTHARYLHYQKYDYH